MIKEHNCGIDLLRLLLMFMVCILHVLGQGGVLANSPIGSIKYSVFWFIEIFSYCAVDAFALISGYIATNKPRKYEKLVNMWFQVFFYSFVITIFFVLVNKAGNIGIRGIIENAFPITFEKYWYMTAYFLLFLAMPILNGFLFKLSKDTAKKVFIIFVVLFSFIGLIADAFKTSAGYSALWLIVLYSIGVLGNKIDLFSKKKTATLICLWALLIICTWYSYVFLQIGIFLNYISPTIVFSGLIMVILFKRLKIRSSFIIKLASLSLGVYLLQLNQVIWNNVIAGKFAFIASENIYLGVLYVSLIALVMLVAGLLVEFVRSKLAKLLKLDLLSKKIVNIINFILKRLSYFL